LLQFQIVSIELFSNAEENEIFEFYFISL